MTVHATEEVSWKYQLRIQLTDELAPTARSNISDPRLAELYAILDSHDGALVCQYDAFAGYCHAAEADDITKYPLYKWTKATIDNPVKQTKYLKIFTIYVGGEEVYEKVRADALEKELQPLVGGSVITQLSKYDSNPANNPQPPKKYQ